MLCNKYNKMGFLTNIFKSKKDIYAEVFIQELKQDKERLIKENDVLKERIRILEDLSKSNDTNPIKQKKSPQKLSEKEKSIYLIYKAEKPNNIKDLSKLTNMKISSLRVYVSRINKKGFVIEFQ